ncbi:MAG: DUF1013 domain-containing protein [Sphingomonadales bacterium]
MSLPIMPKATAVWLIENTALTFKQIGDFCGFHALEVQGIADGEAAQGIVGMDPVSADQLTWEEIERCSRDSNAKLQIIVKEGPAPLARSRGARYTPVSRRQDRPNAIAWLLRYHPELTDPQIARLVGTTKPTITAVRDRTHWNSSNIKPQDPVTLGLCKQLELDAAVAKAAKKQQAEAKSQEVQTATGQDQQTPVVEEPPQDEFEPSSEPT